MTATASAPGLAELLQRSEVLWPLLAISSGRLKPFLGQVRQGGSRHGHFSRTSMAWAAERELAFLRRCADELAEMAVSCVRFSVALWVDLRPDWQEEAADARREVVGEAREELLSELGILGERSGRGRRLTSSKHDVAEFLRPTLLFAALTCADATHELAHPSLPGTAGSTMLGLAASLLTDGDEVATAGDYESCRNWETTTGRRVASDAIRLGPPGSR